MRRPGYYVEDTFYGERLHQARARAAYLSAQYGRGIEVMRLEHSLGQLEPVPQVVTTIYNMRRQA